MGILFKLRGIQKAFTKDSQATPVLNGVDLDIRENEIISIIGPNGCGKTTLLQIISGLQTIDKGRIHYRGSTQFSNIPTGMVFQDYSNSLFDHKTVQENIQIVQDKPIPIDWLLNETILANARHLYPHQISGGMKQLTTILRAFAYNSDLILLDEPFSSLDYSTKLLVQQQMLRLWEKKTKTIMVVCHDIDEAVFISDRVVLLSQKPTRVKKVFDINLPRPRTLEIMNSSAFLEYRKLIFESFKEELYDYPMETVRVGRTATA